MEDVFGEIEEKIEYQFESVQLLQQALFTEGYEKESDGEKPSYKDLVEIGKHAYKLYEAMKITKDKSNFTKIGYLKKNVLDTEVHFEWFSYYYDIFSPFVTDEELDGGASFIDIAFDIPYAIIGAVCIDCKWNKKVIEGLCDRFTETISYTQNYIKLFDIFCEHTNKEIEYSDFEDYSDDDKTKKYYICCYVSGKVFEKYNSSKINAKMALAYDMYNYYLDEIISFTFGEITEDNAVDILDKLSGDMYIGDVTYDFSEEIVNGRTCSICTCTTTNPSLMERGRAYNDKDSGARASLSVLNSYIRLGKIRGKRALQRLRDSEDF